MAKYTQNQCDNSIVTREKLSDGSWFIRGSNEDGEPFEFPDKVSASNASLATSRANAHSYLMASCQYVTAPDNLSTTPESI